MESLALRLVKKVLCAAKSDEPIRESEPNYLNMEAKINSKPWRTFIANNLFVYASCFRATIYYYSINSEWSCIFIDLRWPGVHF